MGERGYASLAETLAAQTKGQVRQRVTDLYAALEELVSAADALPPGTIDPHAVERARRELDNTKGLIYD